MNYKLFSVRVFVKNWERALGFYNDTLGIPTAFRSDEMGWAHLATGEPGRMHVGGSSEQRKRPAEACTCLTMVAIGLTTESDIRNSQIR